VNVDGIKETAAKAPLIGVGTIGDFIREQRQQAQVSLRQLSKLAGVSNPYLSQVERGLRRPSAEILQQIAKGLRISAEQLYVRAGILEDRPVGSDLIAAILADQGLTERQKNVLVEIYESFSRENHTAGLAAIPAARPNAADAAS
jgi:transcriptional regulator with XRE-family HTH domain